METKERKTGKTDETGSSRPSGTQEPWATEVYGSGSARRTPALVDPPDPEVSEKRSR